MKNRLISLCALLALLPLAAQAIPIRYDITFSSNALDADGGVGSFFRDDTTHLISNVTWDFGGGNTGGIDDAIMNWSAIVFGGTASDFFFEILTGQDVHPTSCGTSGVTCSTGANAVSGLFGYPDKVMLFAFGTALGPDPHTYVMQFLNNTEVRGSYSTKLAIAVPEPGTFGLLTLGLFAIGWARRRA